MPNNKKIKVAMLEISPQNKAILEFYFDRAGKGLYSIVNEAEAEALIIDYDQFGAKEHVTEILAERRLPILLISIREQNIPTTIWLAKPLSADELNKAAESVTEILAHIEASKAETKAKEVEAEAEAEAEKAKIVEEQQQEQEFEVLTDIHTEEDESLFDELNTLDETLTEKPLEIDEMVLEKESNLEVTEENNAVESGLAIAGVAASALATTSLIGDDDKDDTLELNDSEIEDNSAESSIDIFDEVLEEETTVETDEDDVDSLLDSLMSEQEDEQLTEEVIENVEEESIFDNLLTDEELEDISEVSDEKITENTLDVDVLQSVDSELEGNFDLQKSINIDTEDEKTAIVEENFTLHHDLEPSTEDVFSDTLEVDYAEVKNKNNDSLPDSVGLTTTEDTEELNLDINDSSTHQEEDITASLDETVDSDFNFDFESPENTHDDITENNTASDLELSLLDEAELEEETDSNEEFVEDDLTTDLDSLLQEVSGENNEVLETSDNLENIGFDEIDQTIDKLENAEFDEIDQTSESSELASEDADDLADTDLQSLLNEVREEANASVSGGFASGNDGENQRGQTEAEKRWMQLCGNENTIKNQKESTKITFKTENHLLGVILEQIKTTKNKEQLFRLKYQDLIVVIDHSQSKVYCNTPLSSDEYSVICHNEIDAEKIKIHDLDYSEERLYRNKIEKNPNRAHSFESFIWTTSLLTSRGRLPENTSVTKSIGLKTWPNLTRLELIPHAMNIAAVFAKNPGNLLEIPNWLNIQQRYVFAFYNAALSLEMIEFDVKKAKKSAFSFGKKDSKKNSEERGFFGRLLKRLKT